MQRSTRQTWFWQLSYAILGFAFLVSVFFAIMGSWTGLAVAPVSIVLLVILNRVINGRRSES